MKDEYSIVDLPYKIAVLCYLYDTDGRLLLLHRSKEPNKGNYSPIGGKLEASTGESPHVCAIRETKEESGVIVEQGDMRLCGMLSETAYEGETHWMIFLFEVTRKIDPSEIETAHIDEGTLEWIAVDDVASLSIPTTDREIIWPLIRQHRGGFFAVDINCTSKPMTWTVREEWKSSDV